MIILTNTTDKIQVKLNGTVTTNQLKCFASYRETTNTNITPLRNAVSTNNTTPVDLVQSPPSLTQRVIDYLSVFNTDTANAIVTIQFNENGTIYELFVATLGVNEKIEFQEGYGFKVFANSGSLKTSLNQGNNTNTSQLSSVVLGSDVINNNAIGNTMQDVTGLSFAVNSGLTYYFKFIIKYSSAITTTGSRFGLNGVTFTDLTFYSFYSLTLTTQTLNSAVTSYDFPTLSNATSATITGNVAVLEGYITASANGVVTARFASEVANSAITAKAGSTVYYQQVI